MRFEMGLTVRGGNGKILRGEHSTDDSSIHCQLSFLQNHSGKGKLYVRGDNKVSSRDRECEMEQEESSKEGQEGIQVSNQTDPAAIMLESMNVEIIKNQCQRFKIEKGLILSRILQSPPTFRSSVSSLRNPPLYSFNARTQERLPGP